MRIRAHSSPGKRMYLLMAMALAALLPGLIILYLQLTRPPETAGGKENKEGYATLFTINGFESDRLYRPEELAVDKDRRIYVVDSFRHRIVVFDRDGKPETKFGARGKSYGQLEFPSGIAIADDGRIFVLSHTQNKIVIFSQSGRVISEIRMKEPEAATIKDGKLYVATAREVMVGDLQGNPLTSFDRRSRNQGEIGRPIGIAVDDSSNVYVSDSLNYRLQAFDKKGKLRWTVGDPVHERGVFDRSTGRRPAGLAIDENNFLYLVDASSGELFIFNDKGEKITRFGGWGKEEGRFYYPSGIAYLGNETFAVADRFNDRIQVIHIPGPYLSPAQAASRIGFPILALTLLLLALLRALRRRCYVFIIV